LDDWEKEFKKNPERIKKPKIVPVEFRPKANEAADADGQPQAAGGRAG
jgi:hypothetical protein